MKVSIQNSTHLGDREVFLFRLKNSCGAYIEVTNYGATLVSAVIPDHRGELQNRILGYKNPEAYFTDPYYLGTTVGRVANRISNAKFTVGGKTYHLDKNDGKNSNHGGFSGLNKKIFDHEVLEDRVIFSSLSQDGEGGYPGNLDVRVSYSFTDNNEVMIDYEVKSDKLTPVSLTNHTYFNLSGKQSNATDHFLKVFAEERLEFDENFIPTGKVLPLKGSDGFDFRKFRQISNNMLLKNERNIKGFNTYYIAKGNPASGLKQVAELKEESSGILLEVETTMPGVQFYTGDYLGDEFLPFGGVCLEAHYFTDFVNRKSFTGSFIEKGEIWKEQIIYRFKNG